MPTRWQSSAREPESESCFLLLIRLSALTSIALLTLATATPTYAKVLADGKPSPGGFYWQKVQKSEKSIQYICRSKKEAGIQKDAKCNGAKAARP